MGRREGSFEALNTVEGVRSRLQLKRGSRQSCFIPNPRLMFFRGAPELVRWLHTHASSYHFTSLWSDNRHFSQAASGKKLIEWDARHGHESMVIE